MGDFFSLIIPIVIIVIAALGVLAISLGVVFHEQFLTFEVTKEKWMASSLWKVVYKPYLFLVIWFLCAAAFAPEGDLLVSILYSVLGGFIENMLQGSEAPLWLILLLLVIFYLSFLDEKHFIGNGTVKGKFLSQEANIFSFNAAVSVEKDTAKEQREKYRNLIRREGAKFGARLSGTYYKSRYDLARLHPNYAGTKQFRGLKAILAFPLTSKLASLFLIYFLTISIFTTAYLQLEGVRDRAMQGDLGALATWSGIVLSVKFFPEQVAEIISGAIGFFSDIFSIFVAPVFDLFPLFFGGAFTSDIVTEAGGHTFNAFLCFAYLGLLIFLFSPLRFGLIECWELERESDDTAPITVTFKICAILAICFVSISNAYFIFFYGDQVLAEFSYLKSVQEARSAFGENSLLERFLPSSSLQFAASWIDEVVKSVGGELKIPIAAFWLWLCFRFSQQCFMPANSVAVMGLLPCPDFVQDYLKLTEGDDFEADNLELLEVQQRVEKASEEYETILKADRDVVILEIMDAAIEDKKNQYRMVDR